MYQVVCQENESIEIGLDDDLSADGFKQVIHQLESLAATYPKINVLFDASHLKNYDFRVVIEEYEFYKKYKDRLERVALVSDRRAADFFAKIFNKFAGTEFAVFPTDKIKDARRWVFASRLP